MNVVDSKKIFRSFNFTEAQVDMLLDCVEDCPSLTSGKLDEKIRTKHDLKLAWKAVAQKINESAVGYEKTADQYRMKWSDMKYRIKQKATRILKFKGTRETLTHSDRRALSLMGWKFYELLGNSCFDTTSATVNPSPVDIFDATIENAEGSNLSVDSDRNAKETEVNSAGENSRECFDNAESLSVDNSCVAVPIKTENDTSNEVPNCIITQENHGESSKENASNSETELLTFTILKTEDDNASNEVLDCNLPSTILIQDIRSESSKGNVSNIDKDRTTDCHLINNITTLENTRELPEENTRELPEENTRELPEENTTENDVEPESSTRSWPYTLRQPNDATERGRRFRAKKRKLYDEEEDRFMKKVFTTQEKMAPDINEIKLSVIDMNYNMKRYIEKMDQKFDKILDLLAIALNADMR